MFHDDTTGWRGTYATYLSFYTTDVIARTGTSCKHTRTYFLETILPGMSCILHSDMAASRYLSNCTIGAC